MFHEVVLIHTGAAKEPQGRERGRAFVVLGCNVVYSLEHMLFEVCVGIASCCLFSSPVKYKHIKGRLAGNIFVAGRAALSNFISYLIVTVKGTINVSPSRWNCPQMR